jgi:hypothetical protein
MTRKDYIQIAKVLREHNDNAEIISLIKDFSQMLKSDNQNFQTEKFFDAVMN